MAGNCWEPINWLTAECELSNNEAVILELTVAGTFAIVLGLIFYIKQNRDYRKLAEIQMKHDKELFELENLPKIEIKSIDVIEDKLPIPLLTPFKIKVHLKNTGMNVAEVKRTELKVICREPNKAIYDEFSPAEYLKSIDSCPVEMKYDKITLKPNEEKKIEMLAIPNCVSFDPSKDRLEFEFDVHFTLKNSFKNYTKTYFAHSPFMKNFY